MKNNTTMFVIGFASSFVAGVALVYLYSKLHQQAITPLANNIYADRYNITTENIM